MVSFNLNNYAGKDELVITENNVNLPSDLRLFEVNPRSLEIRAQKLNEYTLPVEVTTRGSLPGDLSLISMKPDRDSIRVMMAESNTEVPGNLLTRPLDLSSITSSTSLQTQLVIPEYIRLPENTSQEITVAINVKAKES